MRDPKDATWPPHQPKHGEWIWRDSNGNGAFDQGEFYQPASASAGDPRAEIPDSPSSQGWWVDSNGNVWLATETKGIRYFPQQGLDSKGNPIWGFTQMRTFPAPPPFQQVKRIRYSRVSCRAPPRQR